MQTTVLQASGGGGGTGPISINEKKQASSGQSEAGTTR